MSDRRPWFILVAGINGAGKTTLSHNVEFLRTLVETSGADEIEIINPDTVTRQLRADIPALPENRANRLAADLCEGIVWRRIAESHGHFLIETVLSSEKYKPIVSTALKLGWQFAFIYVALPDVETAIARVAARVRQGGHDVPAETIRKRWPRTLANIGWFWERATSAAMFVNELGHPVGLAEKRRASTSILDATRAPHATRPISGD